LIQSSNMRARQSFVVVPLKNPPNLFGGGSAQV
jgi:hypothetical protein